MELFMKVLVINCGSSSLKYTLFEMNNDMEIACGLIECIGSTKSYYNKKTIDNYWEKKIVSVKNHTCAIDLLIKDLSDKRNKVIDTIDEIDVIGHRIVHGGHKFCESVLVTDDVKKIFKSCLSMAPLHMPAHYAGIIAIEKKFKKKPSVLVFDTTFYKTIPDYAYMYAIPYEFYKKDHIKKYGFHGISHSYVSQIAADMLSKQLSDVNLITAHIGNGSSVTAIKKGKAVDTSMGFTPLQGVMMGSRCGDIDPAIITYIINKYSKYKNISLLNDMMNKESGLIGISGVSCDFRDVLNSAKCKNKRSLLALKMLSYSIKKYISAYYGILNGIDCLVFTAGIGENSYNIRSMICKNLEALGIEIDIIKNKAKTNIKRFISKDSSKVKVMVIPTNEELIIAKESIKVISKLKI
jgi:acetate kinase